MTEFWGAVIAGVGATFAGRSLLSLMERIVRADPLNKTNAEVWGFSTLLGMSFTAAAAFIWSDLGRPLTDRFSWGQVALGLVAGSTTIILRWRSRVRQTPLTDETPVAAGLFSRCGWPLIGVMFGLALVQTLTNPQRFQQDREIVACKAQDLYETGSIHAPELRDLEMPPGHLQYPLLLPLLERHLYALSGKVSLAWAQIWTSMISVGAILCFAGVLTRRYSARQGWLVAACLAISPVLLPNDYWAISAQSDIFVSCFHGVAVLLLWDGLQEPPGGVRRLQLFLASSMSSSAVFVNDDGLVDLLVNLLAWAFVVLLFRGNPTELPAHKGRWRSASRHLIGMLMFALIAAILLTPWMRYRSTLSTSGSVHDLAGFETDSVFAGLSNLTWLISQQLFRMFWEWKTGALVWWMVLVALATAPRRSLAGPQVFLLLNLLGAISAFIIAGVIRSGELTESLDGSVTRCLMQIAPIAILFVAGAWGRSRPVAK